MGRSSIIIITMVTIAGTILIRITRQAGGGHRDFHSQ